MRFFFFKQKTAYEMRISDWSSDGCSSDLSARNLLIERARRKAREQCIALPYDEERDVPMQPEQTWRIEEADVRRIYRRTLRAMPRRTRRIFLMHRLKGMSYREIAERSEEHTSELQSLMRISYAVFCLKKK